MRGKCTMEQTQDLLAILRDVLLTVKLDNPERFRQIVLEAKAGQEASLIPEGHRVVNTRLRSAFDEASWVAEQISGVDYLFFLRQLAEAIEEDWPSVMANLEEVRRILIGRSNMICNVTLDETNWNQFRPDLEAFVADLPNRSVPMVQWSVPLAETHEGLTIPAQVNYVAKGANLYQLGYELNGSVSVIMNLLRTTWLWEKIRVQGGAYGGFVVFDKNSGVLSYLSYRDPNLLQTLDNYDGTAGFLRQLEISQEELVKGIIGAIGEMDSYQLPDAKGYTSMVRYLTGESDSDRQKYRDEILATTVADFKAFAGALEQVIEKGLVIVLGSSDAIAAANEAKGEWLRVSKVL